MLLFLIWTGQGSPCLRILILVARSMKLSIIPAYEHHNTSTNDVESGLLLLQSPLEALELQIMTTHPNLHIHIFRWKYIWMIGQVMVRKLWRLDWDF